MKFSSNKGSAAVVVVVIFLAAIVMFVFPLMTMSGKQDEAVALEAQKITTEFVDKWRNTGIITQFNSIYFYYMEVILLTIIMR